MTPPAPTTGKVELLVSAVLRTGVRASIALILAGLVLWFARDAALLTSEEHLRHLLSPKTPVPRTPWEVLSGVWRLEGEAVVALGLLVLIMTPAVRVALSGMSFLRERDRAFVAISAGVLLVLAVSVVLGLPRG
jgi:uncharacterized membrane protein